MSTTVTDRPGPRRVIYLLAGSTVAYALSLATVAGLQAGAEAGRTQASEPFEAQLADVARGHDALTESVRRLSDAYERAAAGYGRVGQALAGAEGDLGDLAGEVGQLVGDARALPDRAPLPPVRVSSGTVAPPAVHGTTGASGG